MDLRLRRCGTYTVVDVPTNTSITIDPRSARSFYDTSPSARSLRFGVGSRPTTGTCALLRLRHPLHRNKPCTSHSYLNSQNGASFLALDKYIPVRYSFEVRRLSFCRPLINSFSSRSRSLSAMRSVCHGNEHNGGDSPRFRIPPPSSRPASPSPSVSAASSPDFQSSNRSSVSTLSGANLPACRWWVAGPPATFEALVGPNLLANDASAPASASTSTVDCTVIHPRLSTCPAASDRLNRITLVDGQLNVLVLPSKFGHQLLKSRARYGSPRWTNACPGDTCSRYVTALSAFSYIK